MKGFVRIKTSEAGKQIVLVANTPQNILVCNIEENNDPSSFTYNPETGELTALNNCVVELSGMLHLVTADEESADLTIDLNLNGVAHQVLYTGINNQRTLAPFIIGLHKDDILEFTIVSPDDVTVETTDTEHYITVKRIY